LVRSDWVSIGIPKGLASQLDEFIKSTEGKNIGVTNRQQLISLVIRKFLEKGVEGLSDSDNLQNNDIQKLEKKFTDVQKKLEKYEDLFFEKDLFKILAKGSSEKTAALHEKDGMKLIMSVDTPDTPNEIVVYHTTDKEKVLKDNHIKGLVKVRIFRKKLRCSYHKNDDSCSHIKYALETDDRFARNAYLKDVKNPILRKVLY